MMNIPFSLPEVAEVEIQQAANGEKRSTRVNDTCMTRACKLPRRSRLDALIQRINIFRGNHGVYWNASGSSWIYGCLFA